MKLGSMLAILRSESDLGQQREGSPIAVPTGVVTPLEGELYRGWGSYAQLCSIEQGGAQLSLIAHKGA